MTTPWSYGKIFWTLTVPQLFSAPVVDGHATVPKDTSEEWTILLSIQSCVCYATI